MTVPLGSDKFFERIGEGMSRGFKPDRLGSKWGFKGGEGLPSKKCRTRDEGSSLKLEVNGMPGISSGDKDGFEFF